jgi:hypothetical protein
LKRRSLLLGMTVATLLALSPAGTGAATTLGDISGSGSGSCGAGVFGYMVGPPYQVPAGGGVITSFSAKNVGQSLGISVDFKIVRTGTIVASTPLLTTTGNGLATISGQHISVQAGDVLGFYNAGNTWGCGRDTLESSDVVEAPNFTIPDPSVGSSPLMLATAYERLLIGATLEPDADGDGFGDETQDQCPSSASTQGPCPVVPLLKKCKHGKKSKKKQSGAAIAKKCKKKHHKASA